MAEPPARHVAVLAGGHGRRIGGGKPLVELAGRALIDWPLAAVRRAGLEAVIVAKAGTELPDDLERRGVVVLTEPDEPVHPLAGVASALDQLGAPVVVCACDMPFVPAELLAWLAGEQPGGDASVVAPEWQDRLQPTLARYDVAALEALRAAVESGGSASAAIERAGLRRVTAAELERFGDPQWIFFDVDSPEDVTRAEGHAAALG